MSNDYSASLRVVRGIDGLGTVQQSVLRALLHHGCWPGGWLWDTRSRTIKVLDSLVKRGLVCREDRPMSDYRGREFPKGHPYHGQTSPVYFPNDDLKQRLRLVQQDWSN